MLFCLTVLISGFVHAQEGQGFHGSVDGNIAFQGYSCDPAACKLPTCSCASMNSPVANPPQFVVLTFDDAIQTSKT